MDCGGLFVRYDLDGEGEVREEYRAKIQSQDGGMHSSDESHLVIGIASMSQAFY